MSHAQIVLTETGAAITATHLIMGASQQDVSKRVAETLKEVIAQAVRDHPQAEPSDAEIDAAVERGYWWTQLGSEEFTAMVVEPEHIVVAPVRDGELTRRCGLILDLADDEVQTRTRCAQDGHGSHKQVRDLVADIDGCRTFITAIPDMVQLLSETISKWPQFDTDEPVPGSEMVDWFSQWRERVKPCITGLTPLSADEDDSNLRNALKSGFVVLTYNAGNDAGRHYEAWAYEGPLDFDEAGPIRYGLGASPVEAIDALNWQLQHNPDRPTD